MANIRKAMTGELKVAIRARRKMEPAVVTEAARLVADLGAVKRQIENQAALLGYSKRCRAAIAVCKGECCRWHFPKTINRVDFFIAVFRLAPDLRSALVEQVRPTDDRGYQCPLLRKDGCIFSFENRPVVCTSAFPCLAGTVYWQYKESFRKEIDAIRTALGNLIDQHRVAVSNHRPGERLAP